MPMRQKRNLLFAAAFTVAGILALQIPLSSIVGSASKFTLFDCLSPIAGAFLGTVPGMISVLFMQLTNLLFHSTPLLDAVSIMRLFPALFATAYFAKKRKINVLVPLLAMLAFNLHPIGRSVFLYSAYWLIPIFCYFWQDRFILARSLGATFTAHAVGSVLWLYAFNLPKTVWLALIPQVALERGVFALGIVLTYLVANNVLNYLAKKQFISPQAVNPKYLWQRLVEPLPKNLQ